MSTDQPHFGINFPHWMPLTEVGEAAPHNPARPPEQPREGESHRAMHSRLSLTWPDRTRCGVCIEEARR